MKNLKLNKNYRLKSGTIFGIKELFVVFQHLTPSTRRPEADPFAARVHVKLLYFLWIWSSATYHIQYKHNTIQFSVLHISVPA